MAKWLVPTLGYAMALGAAGVTRACVALGDLAGPGPRSRPSTSPPRSASSPSAGSRSPAASTPSGGIVSSVLMVAAPILLYVALGAGEAAKVASVGAAYPAVTLLGSALLGEAFTVGRAQVSPW